MTLLMSFVTAEKKTKTNENKTRKEKSTKDKLNIEMFVMLNLRS